MNPRKQRQRIERHRKALRRIWVLFVNATVRNHPNARRTQRGGVQFLPRPMPRVTVTGGGGTPVDLYKAPGTRILFTGVEL